MDTTEIKDENVLEFVIFCIENLAETLHKSKKDIYKKLKDNNILNGYIVPEYKVLHTQSKSYIIDDLIKLMQERGVQI